MGRKDLEIAWASGLLVGEGCIGRVVTRNASGVFSYLSIQIGMYDERAIKRFAETFDVSYRKQFLPQRGHNFFKVHIRGRSAEKVIALMWPYIAGTDKGDQMLKHARALDVEDWVTGIKIGERPQLNRVKRGVRKICA